MYATVVESFVLQLIKTISDFCYEYRECEYSHSNKRHVCTLIKIKFKTSLPQMCKLKLHLNKDLCIFGPIIVCVFLGSYVMSPLFCILFCIQLVFCFILCLKINILLVFRNGIIAYSLRRMYVYDDSFTLSTEQILQGEKNGGLLINVIEKLNRKM